MDCSLFSIKLNTYSITELVEERVDWFLDELVVGMEAITGKRVSIPTLWRSLKYCGITQKKVFDVLLYGIRLYCQVVMTVINV